MEIYSIKDEKFRRYGKVWSGFDCIETDPRDGTHAAAGGCHLCAIHGGTGGAPEAGELARRIYGGLRFRSVIVTAAITD